MSDYCRNKVVRCNVTKEQLGLEDIWDIEDNLNDLNKTLEKGSFEIAPTDSDFIDLILSSTYGEESSDFGRVRKLNERELEKYLPLFKKISEKITPENLRYVDFCWYNCCEATDYFDESQDDFYDEI